jgi:hypothetical protein
MEMSHGYVAEMTDDMRQKCARIAGGLDKFIVGEFGEERSPLVCQALVTLAFVYMKAAGMTQGQVRRVMEDQIKGLPKEQ